ncbi:carboxypeptidase-like regulatory domain-containing protein [Flavobacterium sp.]|uniref:carboxypeptidase-like regulatory domain-containing protein n=1 Tax=Flavobacterium sp. TaxID=239 RepID=UPI003526CE21
MLKQFFLLLFSFTLSAQVMFSGKVIDIKTKETLTGASIYIPNTSIGTTSNFEGYFNVQLPLTTKEIVVSFMGYTTVKIPLTLTEGQNITETIFLREANANLEELVIRKQKITKDWKRKYAIFKANFIGKSSLSENVEILNKEEIYFEEERNATGYVLVANSNSPLLIKNENTGYLMTYDLIGFTYIHTKDHEDYASYFGYLFFEDIVKKEKLNAKKTTKNRVKAYKGSLQHFIKSVFENNFTEEGFEINQYILKDNPDYPSEAALKIRNERIKKEGFIKLNPLPPKKIAILGRKYSKSDFISEENNQQFFNFNDLIRVIYTKENPDKNYTFSLRQMSYLKIDEKIEIFENGNYFPPTQLIAYDYMGWKKIGDALPLDYEPKKD